MWRPPSGIKPCNGDFQSETFGEVCYLNGRPYLLNVGRLREFIKSIHHLQRAKNKKAKKIYGEVPPASFYLKREAQLYFPLASIKSTRQPLAPLTAH
jgi:hypothetical protein